MQTSKTMKYAIIAFAIVEAALLALVIVAKLRS